MNEYKFNLAEGNVEVFFDWHRDSEPCLRSAAGDTFTLSSTKKQQRSRSVWTVLRADEMWHAAWERQC